MKKFVICLFAALTVFVLAIGAGALAANNGGVVGAAENIVGGAVNGAENIVGGVVNGAENMIGGTAEGTTAHENTLTEAEKDALLREEHERNPSTGVGLGLIELAAIGTTMLGTAALAARKRR